MFNLCSSTLTKYLERFNLTPALVNKPSYKYLTKLIVSLHLFIFHIVLLLDFTNFLVYAPCPINTFLEFVQLLNLFT